MNQNLSWIKFYRKTRDNDIMQDPIAYTLFSFILFSCDERGVYVTTRSRLAYALAQSPSTIYKALLRLLKKYQVIDIISNSKVTTIRSLNWDKYQSSQSTVTAKEQQSSSKVADLYNNKNKEYKNSTDTFALEKQEKHKSFLDEIPDTDIPYYQRFTDATPRQIRSIAEDLTLYCDSKGKRYSNYKKALIQWLKRTYPKNPVQTMAEANGYLTLEEAKAKGVFF